MINKLFRLDILKINLLNSYCFKRLNLALKVITNQLLYQLSYKGSKKKLIYNAKMNCNRFVLALFLCPKCKVFAKFVGKKINER
jgi:hypothetical protein